MSSFSLALFLSAIFLPFCFQVAMAWALDLASHPFAFSASYFDHLNSLYCSVRDEFMKMLDEVGIPYFTPQDSFFIMADTSRMKVPQKYLTETFAADGSVVPAEGMFIAHLLFVRIVCVFLCLFVCVCAYCILERLTNSSRVVWFCPLFFLFVCVWYWVCFRFSSSLCPFLPYTLL